MSQLTLVSTVDKLLPDLCWFDLRKVLVETPQIVSKQMTKNGRKMANYQLQILINSL